MSQLQGFLCSLINKVKLSSRGRILLQGLLPAQKIGDAVCFEQIPKQCKRYTVLLTQAGTSAPVATIIENTIGAITLSRNSIGEYYLTSTGLFIKSKTFLPAPGNSSTQPTASSYISLFWIDINTVEVLTQTSDGLGNFNLSDDIMDDVSIEIRLYS